MLIIDPRQATSIANFIATSRTYLGLPERRQVARSPLHNLRWAILRLALLAGGSGALFGGAAMAENNTRAARAPSAATQLASVDVDRRQTRSSLEQMP